MWEAWVDGLIALAAAIGYAEWRVRRALKLARAMHDSAEAHTKGLYARLAERLKFHIEGRQHS